MQAQREQQLLAQFDELCASHGFSCEEFLDAMAADLRVFAEGEDPLVKELMASAADHLEQAALDLYVSTK